MKDRLRFGIVACLIFSAFVLAQSNPSSAEQKQEPPASSADDKTGPEAAPPVHSTVKGGIEVLSDTMGVDFGPYLKSVLDTVKRNWYLLIPESARAPIMRQGKVGVEFAILKNGSVAGMKLVSSSGDVALDRGAWGGITNSDPFPPLPKEFLGPYLALRFGFVYNPDHDPNKITVSPASVHMTTGAQKQFSATVPSAKDSTVLWSLSCVMAVCGSISADGLYTAPLKVPTPPTVIVMATLASDPIKTGSATVNIEASPSEGPTGKTQ